MFNSRYPGAYQDMSIWRATMKTTCNCLLLTTLLIATVGVAHSQGKKGAGAAAASPASSASAAPAPSSGSSAAIEAQMLAFGGLDHISSSIAKTVCGKLSTDAADQVAQAQKQHDDALKLLNAVDQKKALGAADTASNLAKSKIPTVVIFDQASFASLQSYEAFIANARVVVSLYRTLLSDTDKTALDTKLRDMVTAQNTPAAAGTGGPLQPRIDFSSSIDPFSDATTLLSAIAVSANTESPGAIVIPDSAMAVALTRDLTNGTGACKGKIPQVIYPPLFGSSSASDFSSADIAADLQTLHEVRDFVIHKVNTENDTWIAAHQPGVAPSGTKPPATKPPATKPPATTPQGTTTLGTVPPGGGGAAPTANPILSAALTDVNGMYDSFMNSLLQPSATSGAPGSASVIQGYQLAKVLAGPRTAVGDRFYNPAYILLASILSAGGTELDHKTLWTDLSSGDKISYSGGVIVNVALWKSNGTTPLYYDLLRYRVPFSTMETPGNLTNVTKGDNLP
jgi:hypothetical protein